MAAGRARTASLQYQSYGVALKDRDRLAAQSDQLELKVAELQVASPISGVILTPHLQDRIGSYLTEGTELLEVADLDELRADTYAAAIELRDYIEASPVESEAARQRFFQIEQRMNTNAKRLEAQVGSQMNEPVQRLLRGLKRYSPSIASIFKWTPKERQARGAAFLRDNVVPERTAALNATREIESLRSIDLRR